MGKEMEIQEPRLKSRYLLSMERVSSQSQLFTVLILIQISNILDRSQDFELEKGKNNQSSGILRFSDLLLFYTQVLQCVHCCMGLGNTCRGK